MKKLVLHLFSIVFFIFFSYNIFAQDVLIPIDSESKFMQIDQINEIGSIIPLVAQDTKIENKPFAITGKGSKRNMEQRQGPVYSGRGARAFGPMLFTSEIADKIGLSDEQKKKLDDIITNHKKDMIKKNAEISLAEIDLKKLLQEENPDMNIVKENIQKISVLKADVEFAKIKAMFDSKNILTKEQQEKIKQFKKERMENARDNIKEKAKDRWEIEKSKKPKIEKSSK